MTNFPYLPRIVLRLSCAAGLALLPFFASGQDLDLPATGAWNGFLDQINVIECSNAAAGSVRIRVTVKSNSGELLGIREVLLPAWGTQHIQLNQFPVAGQYGTYLIEGIGGQSADLKLLNCFTILYRTAPAGSSKAIDYAYGLAVSNPLRGTAAGLFNSFNPVSGPLPTHNWLSVYNPGTNIFSASVEIYRQDGSYDSSSSFFIDGLTPGERRDYALGHPSGQQVGLYRIIPSTPFSPYGAFLTRYSEGAAGRFNFAFAVPAAAGTCRPGALPASTMDPATNWGEIANPFAQPIPIEIIVRDATGAVRHQTSTVLAPFSQQHVYLNQYIGERQIGSFEARCTDSSSPLRILSESVFYGHRDARRGSAEWAYISVPQTERAREGDVLALPVNTFLGAANWSKYVDSSGTGTNLQLALHDLEGSLRSRSVRGLYGGAARDIAVHEIAGRNFAGLLASHNISASAAYQGELLRVFPDSGGGIGSILNIPARLLPGTALQRGALRVSGTDKHWLTFRSIPFIAAADSLTQGWMELGTDFDQEEYLRVLSRFGINAFLMWSYIAIVDQQADSRIGYHAPRLWPWPETSRNMVPPYRFEFADGSGRPLFNDLFFRRLRSFIAAANERDITAVITIHDGWPKARFAGHPLNNANGGMLNINREYVTLADYNTELPYLLDPSWDRLRKHQWILERFTEKILEATADLPNVIYEVMNEGEWYDQGQRQAFERHFLRFLQSRSEAPRVSNFTSLRSESAAAAVSTHSPTWNSGTDAVETYSRFIEDYYEEPVKPLLFSETVPEYGGGAANREGLMRLMWGSLMAGTSVFVQNDTSWKLDEMDPDPIFQVIGSASRFFAELSYPLDTYTPCEELSDAVVCLGRRGAEYAVYSQAGSSFGVDLSLFTGSVEVLFYNPRTGEWTQGDAVLGGDWTIIEKPTALDWIAVLRNP